jgi:SRSO17 transposase
MIIPSSNIKFINKFLEHFRNIFSPSQFAILKLFILASFKDYKRFSIEALAKELNISYQNLQYFFSDSKLPSFCAINNIRLNILNNQMPTRSTPKGILAIDDSAVPKIHAKKTEGAQVQYCAPLKEQANCNVAVASAFVSESKHFPVDFRPYIPEDQCKHQDKRYAR